MTLCQLQKIFQREKKMIWLYSEVEGVEQGAAVTCFKVNLSSCNRYLDGPG
jgi:hypothetical protein